MREDDHGTLVDASPPVQREDRLRLDPVPWPGPRQGLRPEDPEDPMEGNLDHLPGRDELPEPGPEHRAADCRADHPPREGRRRRGDEPRRRTPRTCRNQPRSAAGLPARVLRRHAAARNDRDGPRVQSEDRHRGRARDGVGRHDPGADPRAARAAAEGAPPVDDPDLPRPQRHGGDVREGRAPTTGRVLPVPRGPGGDATPDDGGSPLIRVRDLKVWFPLRRGLLRELAGRSSLWVRAVDGVSFDVKRGEVFCLVGESGCGKTTTGKALLRLVDATEGDVFFELPTEEYRRYEELRAGRTPDAAARIDAIRRKYSFSWTEQLAWDTRQILFWLGAAAAAFVLGVGLPALAAAGIAGALMNTGFILGASFLCGLLLGVIGSLPPTRPSARTPTVLAVLPILAFNLFPIVAASGWPTTLPGAPFDAPGTWATVWGASSFAMLLGVIVAPIAAGAASKIVLARRRETEGLLGVKMRTLRRRLHLIFQDPYESLNPKQSVFEIVSEPLVVNKIAHDPGEIAALVARALEDAGLRPASEFV